jgi:hypothetical protein
MDQSVPANLHEFTAERPNQNWIADFTYLWTAEGWLWALPISGTCLTLSFMKRSISNNESIRRTTSSRWKNEELLFCCLSCRWRMRRPRSARGARRA